MAVHHHASDGRRCRLNKGRFVSATEELFALVLYSSAVSSEEELLESTFTDLDLL